MSVNIKYNRLYLQPVEKSPTSESKEGLFVTFKAILAFLRDSRKCAKWLFFIEKIF